MRKMKDSGIEWIGEIPESWELLKLKYCAELSPQCDFSHLHDDTLIEYLPMEYIKSGYYISNKSNYSEVSTSLTPFQEGDIVFAKVTPCFENGNIAIMKNISSGFGLGSSELFVVRVSNADTKYLFYWLQNKGFVNAACSTMTGTGGLKRVSPSFVKNSSIVYPPLPEQQAISSYLDRQCALIDSVTEKTKASIEEYKKLRQAVITQAVTKGVRGDRPMKEVENGFVDYIPNNWIYQKVKNFIAMPVIDGPHESPELYDDGIPYISATAIVDSKIDFSLMRGYISAEYCDECDKRYKPQINDILLIKLGASTGQVAIVDTDRRFNIWVPLAAIRCDDSVVPKFIYYSFQSEYLLRQMELSWTYGTQQTLGVKTIEQLRFVLPIIDEQQEIAAYLDKKCAEIDALITKKETFLSELEAYKKSLIYEYVTGKKEVPQA